MQILEIFSKVSGIRCGVVLIKDKSPKETHQDWVEKQQKKKPPIHWEDDSYWKLTNVEE